MLIPGENDGDGEIEALCAWVADALGPDVPLHFTAFHPDWRMTDRPPTPPATLARARRLARGYGLRYVYTGNIHDPEGQSTSCPACGATVIGRDGYDITAWGLRDACCGACGTALPGVFAERPGTWGSRRRSVGIAAFAD